MVKLHHDACNVVSAASRIGYFREFPSHRLRQVFCFRKGNSFLIFHDIPKSIASKNEAFQVFIDKFFL